MTVKAITYKHERRRSFKTLWLVEEEVTRDTSQELKPGSSAKVSVLASIPWDSRVEIISDDKITFEYWDGHKIEYSGSEINDTMAGTALREIVIDGVKIRINTGSLRWEPTLPPQARK